MNYEKYAEKGREDAINLFLKKANIRLLMTAEDLLKNPKAKPIAQNWAQGLIRKMSVPKPLTPSTPPPQLSKIIRPS